MDAELSLHSVHQELFLNSWHFAAFAALAVLVVRLAGGGLPRRLALLGLNAYFLFYFVADLYSLGALALCIAVTYGVGEVHHRQVERLPAAFPLAIAVVMWLVLFGVKNPHLAPPVNPFHHWPLRVIGTSYIVFRCMQYMLDAEMFERRSPLTLVNFVLFFPTLIAGPIERYETFAEWHDDDALLPPESALPALHRIATGYLKKFVLADNLGVLGIFAKPAEVEWSGPALWIGVFSQVALIYLDFSGYCDIMIGLARLMRFELVENFDRPWLARNVQEFWDRWHMSMTHWVRDYCFTPLNMWIARNAGVSWRFTLTVAAYFFTMMLIALWHGVTWGFVVFGLTHATALVVSQLLQRKLYARLSQQTRARLVDGAAANHVRRVITYAFVSVTMLFWFFGPWGTLDVLRAMVGA